MKLCRPPTGTVWCCWWRPAAFALPDKIDGLIFWAFLRDTHGGAGISKKLAQNSPLRAGSAFLPGIGSSGCWVLDADPQV